MNIIIFGGGQLAYLLMKSSPEHRYILISNKLIKPSLKLAKFWYKLEDKVIVSLKKTNTVVTYESEQVDQKHLVFFKNLVYPNLDFLIITQDRYLEKTLATKYQLNPVAYQLVSILPGKTLHLTYPIIIKSLSGGYDGKEQWLIQHDADLLTIPLATYLAEEFCNFDYEASLIVTRDCFGNIYHFPIPKNTHHQQILIMSQVLQDDIKFPDHLWTKIKSLMTDFNIIGTITFEWFVKADQWYFNEIAPRVHNSGHYTDYGCQVSQFRNHILAITGQPIIKPILIIPTTMINLIGNAYDRWKSIRLNYPHVHFYDYEKIIYKKRKMGHLIITNPNIQLLHDQVNELLLQLYDNLTQNN